MNYDKLSISCVRAFLYSFWLLENLLFINLDIMARVAKIEDNSKHYNYACFLYACNTSYANSAFKETKKADI